MKHIGSIQRMALGVAGLLLFPALSFSADKPAPPVSGPVLRLQGGRRLEFVREFSSNEEVRGKRSFLSKVVDLVAGPPEMHKMERPFEVATDSQKRILITDPGARAVHIFDFKRNKYQRLEGSGREDFESPMGIAVDARDNVYVSDSELGKIFVFDARGKFRRYIGELKGEEGYFKRPTGLAIDAQAQRLYVTDTLKHAIYTLDLEGHVLSHFGMRGTADGEFNFPTEVAVYGGELAIMDSMNFRVQLFDSKGAFLGKFGEPGDALGTIYRGKGLAVDSEGHYYMADALLDCVQVFDRTGTLLYYFGDRGAGVEQFQTPTGIHIDSDDTVYVVDSANRRVQVFKYFGLRGARSGGQ